MALIPFPRRLRKLWRAREGIAAVEFGFAIPIVLLGLMGTIEIAMILFVSSLMEGGLRDAARFGITGNGGPAREQTIIDIVNDRTMGLVTVTAANVKTRAYKCLSDIGKAETLLNDVNHNGKWDAGDTYDDANGNGVWDTDKAKLNAGDSGEIVVYDLTVDWHLLTPFLTPFFGNDGTVKLKASTAVRNEPWIVTSQPGVC